MSDESLDLHAKILALGISPEFLEPEPFDLEAEVAAAKRRLKFQLDAAVRKAHAETALDFYRLKCKYVFNIPHLTHTEQFVTAMQTAYSQGILEGKRMAK